MLAFTKFRLSVQHAKLSNFMKKALKKKYASVSNVAKLANCEHQLLFDERYGSKRSQYVEKRRNQGIRAHKQFENQLKATNSDKRCFIATACFGVDAEETRLLRRFRDKFLLPFSIGKFLVSLYYGYSPKVAKFLDKKPVAKQITRKALRLLVRMIKCYL